MWNLELAVEVANLSFGLSYFGTQHIYKYSGIRMHILQTGDKNTLKGYRKNPCIFPVWSPTYTRWTVGKEIMIIKTYNYINERSARK